MANIITTIYYYYYDADRDHDRSTVVEQWTTLRRNNVARPCSRRRRSIGWNNDDNARVRVRHDWHVIMTTPDARMADRPTRFN